MTGGDLVAEHLTVRFGGLTALDDVSLTAPVGAITGLIGPNGAGKSTLFNACAGVVPATGSVRLGDIPLDGLSPARRAQLGVGRTFQRIELFDSMTVRENVALGPESLLAGRRPWCQLLSSPRRRARLVEDAGAALERCGITDLAHRNAGELSTGQRRLVELARVICSPFTFLLLDEPSSGLDVAETERFGSILERFAAESGIGVLLVEHDMHLVRRLCGALWVLDFGKLIHHGDAADVLASPVVRAAYLGEVA